MDFITVDSRLFVEAGTIRQKRLTRTFSRDLLIYAFFFLWFINTFVEKLALARESGTTGKWISVSIYALILLLYAGLLYDFLFRRHWRNSIPISAISKLEVTKDTEGLETNVLVTIKSRRYRMFRFRTLEKQYDLFVEAITGINPDIRLVTAE